jgi:hypothetical protein
MPSEIVPSIGGGRNWILTPAVLRRDGVGEDAGGETWSGVGETVASGAGAGETDESAAAAGAGETSGAGDCAGDAVCWADADLIPTRSQSRTHPPRRAVRAVRAHAFSNFEFRISNFPTAFKRK